MFSNNNSPFISSVSPVFTIGNNISEYSWNATDEFGDRLANGVYLYKVNVKHNGKGVKSYSTAGDGSFKENIGKLYIMR